MMISNLKYDPLDLQYTLMTSFRTSVSSLDILINDIKDLMLIKNINLRTIESRISKMHSIIIDIINTAKEFQNKSAYIESEIEMNKLTSNVKNSLRVYDMGHVDVNDVVTAASTLQDNLDDTNRKITILLNERDEDKFLRDRQINYMIQIIDHLKKLTDQITNSMKRDHEGSNEDYKQTIVEMLRKLKREDSTSPSEMSKQTINLIQNTIRDSVKEFAYEIIDTINDIMQRKVNTLVSIANDNRTDVTDILNKLQSLESTMVTLSSFDFEELIRTIQNVYEKEIKNLGYDISSVEGNIKELISILQKIQKSTNPLDRIDSLFPGESSSNELDTLKTIWQDIKNAQPADDVDGDGDGYIDDDSWSNLKFVNQ